MVNKSAKADLRATKMLFDMMKEVEQHLGRSQIGARRLVDHLRDDRLAFGDLAPLAIDRGVDRLVQRRDNNDDMSLRRGPRGLPDWPFWNGRPRGGLP